MRPRSIWPDRKGEEFDVVLFLYSLTKNRRLRLKLAVADGEVCPSVTAIWAGANWMEREIYDMFGICLKAIPISGEFFSPPTGRDIRFVRSTLSVTRTTNGRTNTLTTEKSTTIPV